jgi:signal transduction histidine kinase
MSAGMAEFFRRERDALLAEWRKRVLDDPEVPVADSLSRPALDDHLPLLLEQLAVRFEKLPLDAAEAGRGVGMTSTAHEHALLRFDQNYNLRAALRELAIFRQVVLDRADETQVRLEHDISLAFHAAMDEAQATSALEMERLRSEELRESAATLRFEAELRERFVATLSHDLRTPLQTVVLSAQALLSAANRSDELARKALGRIVDNGQRMSRMIEDLLDFSRTRQGTMPLRPTPTDLTALAREIAEELARLNPARHIHVHSEGNTVGIWDSDRLAQVLANLIGNALTHGANDAPIHVSVLGNAERVTLNVHNGGLPMSKEALDHAFEPYFRASSSSGGLGLGLFIVREIARAHGGDVEASSSALDGTSFLVTLPRRAS